MFALPKTRKELKERFELAKKTEQRAEWAYNCILCEFYKLQKSFKTVNEEYIVAVLPLTSNDYFYWNKRVDYFRGLKVLINLGILKLNEKMTKKFDFLKELQKRGLIIEYNEDLSTIDNFEDGIEPEYFMLYIRPIEFDLEA